MKELEYPYGLLEDGRMVNHHNYDAAVLFRYGWRHAEPAQKEEIRSQVSRMLDYCLGESLAPDGSFSTYAEDSLGAAFYFGVALLESVGYFSKHNRFWTDREVPEAPRHRDLILNRLNALGLDDPEALWAKWILAAYKFAGGAGKN
jgi:hypothetical protein